MKGVVPRLQEEYNISVNKKQCDKTTNCEDVFTKIMCNSSKIYPLFLL